MDNIADGSCGFPLEAGSLLEAGGTHPTSLSAKMGQGYRGTSLIRKHLFLGPYSRAMPRALWWLYGGVGAFLMSEVPL